MGESRQPSLWRRWELPTWGVFVLVYGSFAALTWYHASIPWWALVPLGGYTIALHGSLQHETIHGHPTAFPGVNAALGYLPLSLWFPYPIYRETHLRHHRVEELTSPHEDPESYYVTGATWAAMSRWSRGVRVALNTLLGRLVLGPPAVTARFWWAEAKDIAGGDLWKLRVWTEHFVLYAALMAWVVGACGLGFVDYLLLFVWPGVGLSLLRSYHEHRPSTEPDHRTAVVEAHPVWAFMFLNNNLHAPHHEAPDISWYDLPGAYRQRRDEWRRTTGEFVFAGYFDLLRQFAVRPKDSPVHPFIA
jgi:fatty acid desaturase